jgi:uncharacterized protein YecE (DUF72 family)
VVLDARVELAMCERTLQTIEPLREAGKLRSLLLQLTPAVRPRDHQLGELETLLEALRAHGRNAEGYLKGRTAAERFDWRYKDAELREIADRARRLAREATHVRLMFGNGAHALEAAQRTRVILGQCPVGEQSMPTRR